MAVPCIAVGRLLSCAAVAATLFIVACGGSDDDETTTTPTTAATTTTEAPPRDGPPADAREPPVGDGQGGVQLEKLGDFSQPVYITQPSSGDEALFVIEQCGRIVRVGPGGQTETFLDVSELITCGGEQGLLSAAFAPDYQRSGLFYVNYTATDGTSRTVEYRRSENDSGAADPDSAREVLQIEDFASNHNGGLLLFGPDDNLYLGMGDGGGGGDPERTAQDLSRLLGKIIRIDPRPSEGEPYTIPRDNPFVDREGARPEIWAYGLRNPWRFSFDPQTQSIAIGDVGQSALEEIDIAFRYGGGTNFGWSAFEGTERFNEDQEAPGAFPPTLVYGRDGGCSVTGGYVVRDPELPSLYGRYLYGDFCEGELRSFTPKPGGEASDDTALGVQVPSLSSFGEDASGRVYATSLEGPVYLLSGPELTRYAASEWKG
jgi:glucose/arabinose dehydrogenase